MASIKVTNTGSTPITGIRIREQSESQSTNRYVSGSVPGTIIFNSIPDGLPHTYVVTLTTQNCGTKDHTFTLIEPCKSQPSIVVANDCSTNKIKITVNLDNSTTAKVKLYNGSTLINNSTVNVGAATDFDVPANVNITIVAEHPIYSGCSNSTTHILNCETCDYSISASNPRENAGPDPEQPSNNGDSTNNPSAYQPSIAQIQNGTYDGANYFSLKTITRDVSPFHYTRWTNPIGRRLGQASVVAMGGASTIEYGSNINDLIANIPKINRFNDISQSTVYTGVGDTTLSDNTASGFNVEYTLDDSTIVVPTNGQVNHGNYNYLKINLNNVSSQDARFGNMRFDVEHAEADDKLYWLTCRQVWENGKYRHQRNGGTDFIYKTMSDDTWYNLFLDQITRFGVLMYKKPIQAANADGTVIKAACYGVFGHKNSVIWNRVVQINGVTQQPISYWNNMISTTDRRVGLFPFRLLFPADPKLPWFPIDRAVVPMNTGEVTGIPSRFRFTQLNSIDSEKPQMRFRLEDENGNLCLFSTGEPVRVHIVYRTKSGIEAFDSSNDPGGVVFLRTENGQKPDVTYTFTTPVDLTWWKLNSNPQYLIDRAIAQQFKESHFNKQTDGRLVAGQIYPYMVQNCCEMFGTCPGIPFGQGQCEATATLSVDTSYFVGLWVAREPENIKSFLWQAADGVRDVNASGARLNYYGNVGSIAKANTFKALDTFDKYKRFYQGSFTSILFDLSYDNGTTWLQYTSYLNDLYSELDRNTDVKKAAVKMVYNLTNHEYLIAGKPIYTDQISVLIRYKETGNGPYIVKPLTLKNSYDDQWYFEWYNGF